MSANVNPSHGDLVDVSVVDDRAVRRVGLARKCRSMFVGGGQIDFVTYARWGACPLGVRQMSLRNQGNCPRTFFLNRSLGPRGEQAPVRLVPPPGLVDDASNFGLGKLAGLHHAPWMVAKAALGSLKSGAHLPRSSHVPSPWGPLPALWKPQLVVPDRHRAERGLSRAVVTAAVTVGATAAAGQCFVGRGQFDFGRFPARALAPWAQRACGAS